MDFCVKCGKKDLYKNHLCNKCYNHINKPKVKKAKIKNKKPEQHQDYFEAIIQLRNTEEGVIKFVYANIEMDSIVIAKEKWSKHGVDIFVDNKIFARNLGKTLHANFGGMLKSSATLFSRDRQSGKNLYRLTVLFKQFPYKKGETFMFKGERYKILKLGKTLLVENEKNKKRVLRFKDLERDRVF